ncbi:uracil-DNA glycosylase [Candidatus Woesearchaeota archaeon]|nr:uracil-DNA glycosylase [Candidatus Woesearchaeota archaeon]RLE40506.1 MAG: uracil-DNA glycosylase [Candidatus Woesearchaeota archaeon]
MGLDLKALAKKIEKCRLCRLWKSRKKAVPGEGPENAKIMFIGQAPGKQEDATGKPFVGKAGKFLNALLDEIGFDRQKCFITSVVKCFPPKNRPPRADEAMICIKNYLAKQIELVNPKLVVLLGKIAQRYVPDSLLSGRIVLKTAHPAAGMRFPKIRRKMKKDFSLLKKLIKEIS